WGGGGVIAGGGARPAPPAAAGPGATPGATVVATVTPRPTAVPTSAAGTASDLEPAGAATVGHTQLLAADLFSKFLFPFEVTSILLLGAILGASVLARKRPEHA